MKLISKLIMPGLNSLENKARQILAPKYKLKKLENRVSPLSKRATLLSRGGEKKFSSPKFLTEEVHADFAAYDGRFPAPDIYLHETENASVIGRTEFILHGDTVFYPHLIDPVTDTFMAELEGKAKVSAKRDEIKLVLRPGATQIDKAISILGQCNGNYFHFLTEALTRLALAEAQSDLDGFPVIVEDNLNPKLYEALDILNVTRREIIFAREYERIKVRKLIYITPPCYSPPETRSWFEHRKLAPPRMGQFQFSTDALRALRSLGNKTALHYVPRVSRASLLSLGRAKTPNKKTDLGHVFQAGSSVLHSKDTKLIYCERRPESVGNGRLVRNENIVIPYLKQAGFTSIHLPDYSFIEQASILNEADIVVSPVGASIGNLIFAKPGISVLLLSPMYEGASFFCFANLMGALGHKLTYVLGRQVADRGQNRYNRDFWVPINLMGKAISDLKRKSRV